MTFHVRNLGVLCLLLLPVMAEEAGQEKAKPQPAAITASLVPVGSSSDAYWTGDGPGVKAVAIDPDAAPPAVWTVRSRSGFVDVPSTLNRPTAALPVAGGMLRVFAGKQAGKDGEPPLFGAFPIPAEPGHYEVFLNRSPERKTWEEPERMILASSQAAFPNGSFRIVNLHAGTVLVKIGGTQVDVPARRSVIHTPQAAAAGRMIQVQAARPVGKQVEWILRTGVRVEVAQRVNLVFYPSRNPKSPCTATWYYQYDPESPDIASE